MPKNKHSFTIRNREYTRTASIPRDINGVKYEAVLGFWNRGKVEDNETHQYLYDTAHWTEEEARAHTAGHVGTFLAAEKLEKKELETGRRDVLEGPDLDMIEMETEIAQVGEFLTLKEVTEIAETYDPKVHEAPMVVDHPTPPSWAHGWVKSLSIKEIDGKIRLFAKHTMMKGFARLVNKGLWKKRSVGVYLAGHASNPNPGKAYLMSVGWLGSLIPAIKGMADPTFALNFSEQDAKENKVVNFETVQEEKIMSDKVAPVPFTAEQNRNLIDAALLTQKTDLESAHTAKLSEIETAHAGTVKKLTEEKEALVKDNEKLQAETKIFKEAALTAEIDATVQAFFMDGKVDGKGREFKATALKLAATQGDEYYKAFRENLTAEMKDSPRVVELSEIKYDDMKVTNDGMSAAETAAIEADEERRKREAK